MNQRDRQVIQLGRLDHHVQYLCFISGGNLVGGLTRRPTSWWGSAKRDVTLILQRLSFVMVAVFGASDRLFPVSKTVNNLRID